MKDVVHLDNTLKMLIRFCITVDSFKSDPDLRWFWKEYLYNIFKECITCGDFWYAITVFSKSALERIDFVNNI